MTIKTAHSQHTNAEELNSQHSTSISATITDLVVNGNLEYSFSQPRQIREAAELLPRSIAIYVPNLPGKSYTNLLSKLTELKQAGFDPVPHIAARRVPSRQQLKDFLQQANSELGTHRVMLIGGDTENASGPYNDAIELLEDGILADQGINEAGLAGYPEGHPRVKEQLMNEALTHKLKLAAQQGISAEIFTQFCFNPGRIIEYSTRMAKLAPGTPIYVGMAGPTQTKSLLRFAKQCGVSTSLRGLIAMGFNAARLFSNADPSNQLIKLAGYCARHETNIIGVHIFSFGGFLTSAKWMREKVRRPNS
jgi:methylenetetrahydrofolate reductase (NADPH)